MNTKMTANMTKNAICTVLYNALVQSTRDNGSNFYHIYPNNLSVDIADKFRDCIMNIHNGTPNDIEYNWIHTALSRLSDENLDDEFDISECEYDFELIYTKEIIEAIHYLDIDIYAKINEDDSIANIIQYAFYEYMNNAVYQLYELICSIHESLIDDEYTVGNSI